MLELVAIQPIEQPCCQFRLHLAHLFLAPQVARLPRIADQVVELPALPAGEVDQFVRLGCGSWPAGRARGAGRWCPLRHRRTWRVCRAPCSTTGASEMPSRSSPSAPAFSRMYCATSTCETRSVTRRARFQRVGRADQQGDVDDGVVQLALVVQAVVEQVVAVVGGIDDDRVLPAGPCGARPPGSGPTFSSTSVIRA